MTVVTKAYTFAPATDIKSAEVNENFDRLYNYINSDVIVRDASKAFTVIPAGPGTDPTSPNQFSRKQYVDDKAAAVDATVTTNKTATDAQALARPTFTSYATEGGVLYSGTTQYTTGPTVATTQFKIAAGSSVFTNTANITFQTAFPNGLVSVVTTVGDNSAGDIFKIDNESKTGFSIQAWRLNPANPGVWDNSPGSCRVNWIAIGW